MTVGIAGLGLIGGSFAKAIVTHTSHNVLGFDISDEVLNTAMRDGAVHGMLCGENIGSCDVIITALYPAATIDFIKKHAKNIKPGTVITDCCGTKRLVCSELVPLAKKYGFHFIGGHPMAGTERSSYKNSFAGLFSGASMILCPDESISSDVLDIVSSLCISCGFGKITVSTAQTHDKIIAYTSQLAHIVSGAYIKSETSARHSGYSAGSFKDMTRVASLNEAMWTELMLENRDYLKTELDALISRLGEYSNALGNGDAEKLRSLLREGKEKKLQSEV